MKRILIVSVIVLTILVLCGSTPVGAEDTGKKLNFETERQKESYSVGFRSGIRLYGMVKNNDIDLDMALEGIKDAVAERSQIPPAEMQKIYARFKDKLTKRQEARKKAEAQRNKLAGENFLKENAARQGVIVTKSGLQYRILEQGSGPIPEETDIAVVHYRGTLIGGKEVFNTYTRGEPVKLPVQRSLPAWKEALQLMKVGTKFELFIPPDLAYKNHGRPPLIAGNTVLIYHAELVDIEKQQK